MRALFMVSVLGLAALMANGGTMGGEDTKFLPNGSPVTVTLPKFNGNIAYLKTVYVELQLRLDNARVQLDNDADVSQTGTALVLNNLTALVSGVPLTKTDSEPFNEGAFNIYSTRKFTLSPNTNDVVGVFNAQPGEPDYANWEPGRLTSGDKGNIHPNAWSNFVGSGTFGISVETEYFTSANFGGPNGYFEGNTPSGQIYAKVRYDYVEANLFGYLFKDKDSDLIRTTGDTTITNALVTLIVNDIRIDSTHTDTNGYYYFADVPQRAVKVQAVQAGATLIAIPTVAPASENEMRNRALLVDSNTSVIEYTVAGQGILSGVPNEPLNFGYSVHPLSTALDLRVYTDANGKVMIEISTANENGNHDIEIYAMIDGVWTLVATVPSDQIIGFGSNTYKVEAVGLTAGASYRFQIVDESGHIFESGSIKVARSVVAVQAMTLAPEMVSVSFATQPDTRYQVMVCEKLGAPWKVEWVQYPTAKGWSELSNQAFTAGPDGSTEVLVPRNNRAKAFFKIIQVP